MTDTQFWSKFWDLYARCYDDLMFTRPYHYLMRDCVRVAVPAVKQDGRVLEIGCGTANFLMWLRDETGGGCGEVVGIDASQRMLDIAERKLRCTLHRPCSHMVTLIRADANEPLQVQDQSCDVVACIHVLYALSDPAAVLRECHRVLKPGGRLIVVNPVCLRPLSILAEHVLSYPRPFHVNNLPREADALARAMRLIALNLVVVIAGERRTIHVWDLDRLTKAHSGFRIIDAYPVYANTSLLVVSERI